MKSYKTRLFKMILLVVLGGVVVYGCFMVAGIMAFVRPSNDRDNHDPAKQKEMMAISLKAGGFALIPKGATIKTVEAWLGDSKGIKTAKVVNEGGGRKYILAPGEGFNHGYVLVDSAGSLVTVYIERS